MLNGDPMDFEQYQRVGRHAFVSIGEGEARMKVSLEVTIDEKSVYYTS